jgi:ABC-type cobalamin/Fe3+-siderophores transport system ATPase subunit
VHHISSVQIENFRSIKNHEFPLAQFTALVGYNNAGKTNLLEAVNWLVKKSSLDSSMFCDKEQAVTVTAVISGIDEGVLAALGPTHRPKIEPLVTDEGTLIVRRTQGAPGAKAADIKLTIRQTDVEGEEMWSNPAGIDAAISYLFPDPIMIGAMENTTEDVGKFAAGTTIGKLIKEIIGPITEAHSASVSDALGALNRKLSASGEEKDETLVSLDERIHAHLSNFFPGVTAKTHIPTPGIEDFFKGATIRVFEEGFEHAGGRDAGAFGHGAQRSIQIALIACLAGLKREAASIAGRTTLLLIDEPELYLHPQAIEVVRASLTRLAGEGYQVLFSTHSPLMISRDAASKALLVRRSEARGTHAFPRVDQAVVAAVEDGAHQAETLFALTNSAKFLFSEKVLFAEGKTESVLLPEIFAHEIGATVAERRTAIISLGGSSNFPSAMRVLEAMGIPVRALVDLDFAFKVAGTYDLLPADHAGVLGCKEIFGEMGAAGEIALSDDGLPRGGNGMSAAKAYALMAERSDAAAHIEMVHADLLQRGIWCWTAGSIEDHLGLQSKSAGAHCAFLAGFREDGYCEALPHYAAVRALVQWL